MDEAAAEKDREKWRRKRRRRVKERTDAGEPDREHTIRTGTVAWPDRTQDSQHGEKAEGGQGRHSQCPCLRRLLLPATSRPLAPGSPCAGSS